jgi:hypothetical protein
MTTTQNAMTLADPPAPVPAVARGLDPRIKTALVSVGGFAVIFAIAAGATWGAREALSVAAGGVVAVLNLYGLARILGALLGARTGTTNDTESGLWGVFAVFKVVGLFGGVWLLMSSKLVDPIALVVGWGALPVGIAVASVFSDKRDPETASRANHAPPPGSS